MSIDLSECCTDITDSLISSESHLLSIEGKVPFGFVFLKTVDDESHDLASKLDVKANKQRPQPTSKMRYRCTKPNNFEVVFP